MTELTSGTTAAKRMFEYDPVLTERFLELCRGRLESAANLPVGFGSTRAPTPGVLDGLITDDGTDPERVLELFLTELAPGMLVTDSPDDLAYVPHAPTQAARLFDMWVACASLPGTHWLEAAGAITAENQALRVLTDLAGMPDGAGGCFVSGGSMGNLSALYVARERYGARAKGRPRVALSAETHVSAALALRILGMDAIEIPTDDHRLTGETLRAALDADANPEGIVAVVGTAGTTNAGMVDDLEGIATVAHEREIWMHIDGAYGGAGLFVPELRNLYRGVELCDSIVIDPHKWLFTTYDCGALLYRDPKHAKDVLAQHASYLEILHTDDADEWNPGDFAFHLTRRMRGLPFWYSLVVYGLRAYREAIAGAIDMAHRCARMIEERPYLELIREPELSVVLFRRNGWGRDDYLAWCACLLAEQRAHVAPTGWEGQPCARLAFGHPQTSIELAEAVLDSMA
jgi:aromatic-L-amino-acid/L-tryptophan decarboxylase